MASQTLVLYVGLKHLVENPFKLGTFCSFYASNQKFDIIFAVAYSGRKGGKLNNPTITCIQGQLYNSFFINKMGS